MDEYRVRMTAHARQDLDGIYDYIAVSHRAPDTALSLVERIEKAINSLYHMPYRCPKLRRGGLCKPWIPSTAGGTLYCDLSCRR